MSGDSEPSQHLASDHSDGRDIDLDMEKKMTKSRETMEGLIHCGICEYKSLQPEDIWKHMEMHGQSNFICSECGDDFTQPFDLKRHIISEHANAESFECDSPGDLDGTIKQETMDSPQRTDTNIQETHAHMTVAYEDKSGTNEETKEHCSSDSNITVSDHSVDSNEPATTSNIQETHQCIACEYNTTESSELNKHLVEQHTAHDSRYKCLICNTTFARSRNLGRHMINSHVSHKCIACDYRTTKSTGLKHHLVKEHAERQDRDGTYKCLVCSASSTYTTSLDLERHMVQHTGEKSLKCNKCDYVTDFSNCLKRHKINEHSHEWPFICVECGEGFASSSDLKRHEMSKHTGERPHLCPQCDCRYISSFGLNRHIRTKHDGGNRLKCDKCDFECSVRFSMKEHIMREHTGEKPYKCQHCDYSCIRSQHMKTHVLNKHSGGQQFKYHCSECSFVSSRPAYLKTHVINQHGGERKFVCAECSKRFASSGLLAIHKRNHVKELACPHCDLKCARAANLKQHIMVKHTHEQPHVCTESGCDKKYSRRADLLAHSRNVHSIKLFECSQCSYKAGYAYDLDKHVRRKHLGEYQFKCSKCDYKATKSESLTHHLTTEHGLNDV